MRLTKLAISVIRGSGIEFKKRLAEALQVSLSSIHRIIKNNDDSLTKASALKLIREELGLDDSQILEESIAENIEDRE